MSIIAFKDLNGVGVLYPADCGWPIDEIAKKDVPSGCPYVVISSENDIFEIDWTKQKNYGLGQSLYFKLVQDAEKAKQETLNQALEMNAKNVEVDNNE